MTGCAVKVGSGTDKLPSTLDAGSAFNDNDLDGGVVTTQIDATPDAPPITATAFITQYGNMFCAEAFTCKSSDPNGSNSFQNDWDTSESNCDADALTYYNPTRVESDIASGKITYNPANASACLAGTVFTTCADFWNTGGPFPDACKTALVGTVAIGGSCQTLFECQSQNCGTNGKCLTPGS